MTRRWTWLPLAFVVLTSVEGFAEDLVLADGRYLQVKIQEVTERGLRVRLLSSGGEVWVPWSLVREADRERLQVRFGLKEEAVDVLVDGVRVTLRRGEVYLGVPVGDIPKDQIPDEGLTIWHEGTKLPFRKDVIARVEWTRVPGLEAFTVEQLYDRKLAERNPAADDLEGHWDMAGMAAAIGAYDKAIVHLRRVTELDSEYRTEYVANQVVRLEEQAKNVRIEQEIRRARRKAHWNLYRDSLDILDQVAAVPDLPARLAAEVGAVKQYVLKRRWEYFKAKVRGEYFRLLDIKVAKLSRRDDLDLKEAQREIRRTLHKEIMADIAQKFGLDAKEELPKMWEEREVHSVRTASYGPGTFVVLGPAKGAQNQQQQLEQALRAQLQQGRRGRNQQQQQQAPADVPKPPTPDEWWKRAPASLRADWMKAYFAETGGQLKIEGERWYDCPRCGATGHISFVGSQGANLKVTCPRCQGHRRDKGVSFK